MTNDITCPDCGKPNVKLTKLVKYTIKNKCLDCGWFITITTMMTGGIYVATKAHPEGATYY